MVRHHILWFAILVFFSNESAAQDRPADKEWSKTEIVELARCFVSEADWSMADHAAIAWVLWRRWKTRKKWIEDWTFLDQVRAYCRGLSRHSQRANWVRELQEDGSEPEHWRKSDGPWERYRHRWMRTTAFAQAWAHGKVRSPCDAFHWGGPMDPSEGRAIDCGLTFNIFYARESD